MGMREIKLEQTLASADAARLLREIAAELDSPRADRAGPETVAAGESRGDADAPAAGAADVERATESATADAPPEWGAPALGLTLRGFNRLELNLKRRQEKAEIKLRVRLEDPPATSRPSSASPDDPPAREEPPAGNGRERYKRLKKRMEESFKSIRHSVRNGALPRPEDLAAFVEDAARMVTYPGHGEEHYDEFIDACEELRAACDGGDLEGARAAVSRVRGLEACCHEHYR